VVRRHLTYANVVSTIALFCVLGGGAYALSKNSVGSRQIKDDSIRSKDIKNRAVKGHDIKDDTITSRQIEEGRFDMSRFFAMNSGERLNCDPGSTTVSCVETTLNLREPSQVLLVGAGSQTGNGVNADGACELRAGGQRVGGVLRLGSDGSQTRNGFGITGTTRAAAPLPPGTHTFRLLCRELSAGDIQLDTYISALALGGNP
jgi:hypothetical protein